MTGTFRFDEANVVTNAAVMVLDGGSTEVIDLAGPTPQDGLRNLTANAAGGRFTVLTGRKVIAPGDFINAGAVTAGPGAAFGASGTYTQTAGTTRLDGGVLTAGALVDIQGGSLAGSGAILGSVRNAGRVEVGGTGATGLLFVLGDYAQTAAGTLHVEAAGPGLLSEHDLLFVQGTATLAGRLEVGRLGGYVPGAGDLFLPLYAGGRSGTFDTFNGLTIGPTRAYVPFAFDQGLVLVATDV